MISTEVYNADNYNKICDVVNALPEDDAASIRKVKKLFSAVDVCNNLIFIAVHYSMLPKIMWKLEKKGDPTCGIVKCSRRGCEQKWTCSS